MRIEEIDYELPEAAIAQHPLPQRDASRLLRLDRRSGAVADDLFRNLPELLQPGDLLVLNNARVIPARLHGHRAGVHAQPAPSPQNPAAARFLQGAVEALLVREIESGLWDALVRPGRKLGLGERLHFGAPPGPVLEAEIVGRGNFGERQLRFSQPERFWEILPRIGHTPLPPYIRRPRAAPDEPEDRERYQTVFARASGSVAAPTAGLHFTPEIFHRLEQRGVERVEVTLEVGLGTFQPIHEPEVERHAMHEERYAITAATAAALGRARRDGRRIVAVGTTAVRTLESSAAAHAGEVVAEHAATRLFLYPGRPFRVVDAMLTNFHAPRSTLLALVCAFAGREPALNAYRHALARNYRFLSYGDCMFIG